MIKKRKNRDHIYLSSLLFLIAITFFVGLIVSCVSAKGIEQGAIQKGAVTVSPNAVNIFGELEEIKLGIDKIGKQNNAILQNQTQITNSGSIKYGGAGWVVLGVAITIVLFLVCMLVVLYMILKSRTNSLSLVTSAVHSCDSNTKNKVKEKINHITSNGGPYQEKDKEILSRFVKTNNVDAE